MIEVITDNINGVVSFYKMNWYGFAIGHYMIGLGLTEVGLLALKVYVDRKKGKNDIRRFQIDGHRK
jgi:hypothetical protein